MLHKRNPYLAAIVAALGALLVVVSSAAAAAPGRIGFPLRKWSVSRIEQGVGKVLLSHGTERSDDLDKIVDLGPAAFDLGPLPPLSDRAAGEVSSRNNGEQPFVMAQAPVLNPFEPRSAKGGVAHLDQYQVYEKPIRHADASLPVAITQLILELVDANGALTQSECPVVGTAPCSVIRSLVRFRVRAYPKFGRHDFFDSGGAVYAEGHQHAWFPAAATLPDSRRPFFPDAAFLVNRDLDQNGSQQHFQLQTDHDAFPPTLEVPLRAVGPGQQFVVQVTMDAETIDDRGHESGALALIVDPQLAGPRLVARGLASGGAPAFKEPPIQPRPASRCPSGPLPHAGTVQFSSRAFTVGEASGTPIVLVTRRGGSRGATSVIVRTSGGTARSGADLKRTQTLVRFENGDTSPRFVEIPIREDLTAERPENFTVSLSHLRCSKLGKQKSAGVTILDDDQPPPPPAPEFTIGGSVDGLLGSGLVLTDLGGDLAVSGNGSFTLPGTRASGESYEVKVGTQPINPDQLCTVQNGTGRVGSANVSDVAVHCQTPAIPSGLDLTFGDGGRVSTPVGGNGQGEGVVIQPSGQIVTAGSRTVGTGLDTDFALTRNNSDGSLDTSFGTGGIATTDLGGPDDQALDAALLPDSGIVAVGRTDALGILKTAFGVVRYLPDGTLNPNFGSGGIVTTPFFGKGAVADAVAVQPDGKILVAGRADEASGFNSDFALARYNPDGALDTSFDGDGIVTTDLSGQDDDIAALAIQPDGKIVAVGTAGEDIALARYTPDGTLDTSFGNGGFKITDLGFVDVANGVALTPSGQIVIAGYTIGSGLNNDFLLARYNTNGTLDTTFGTGGTVKTDLSGGDDFAENLTIDATGRIVVVGRATSPTILDMALARYNPDGTLDTSFANHGTLTADFHGRGEFGQDVALDSAGRIVAAGYTANGSGTDFALMRASP